MTRLQTRGYGTGAAVKAESGSSPEDELDRNQMTWTPAKLEAMQGGLTETDGPKKKGFGNLLDIVP